MMFISDPERRLNAVQFTALVALVEILILACLYFCILY